MTCKYYFQLGKSAYEMYRMIEIAFGDSALIGQEHVNNVDEDQRSAEDNKIVQVDLKNPLRQLVISFDCSRTDWWS